MRLCAAVACAPLTIAILGCPLIPPPATDDGDIADGIMAPLGDPLPSASADQLAAFERGKAIFLKRFDLADGLGPAFNVAFCGACHEKPVPGGSAGLYRNFTLAGRTTSDGAFLFAESAGNDSGVVRMFDYDDSRPARPTVPDSATIFTQRNGIPFFGAGLIAELDEEAILANADPDDEDGDGISGRPNFDRGFVGRFGRKAQTVSIEGFIRGPLFNHLGITTEPLTEEQRAALPVDSSLASATAKGIDPSAFAAPAKAGPHMQAAAPDAPNFDDDDAPDPELSGDDLFDLVSFVMLMAAPEFEPATEQSERGRQLFHQANCSACHVPRLEGPRGPIPLYSDLLLHDMGDELADGVVMNEATGNEFRTQPLWGLAAVGPYLHDGRASTIEDAILAHGGEAQASRDAFAALSESEQADLIEFLMTLGGRSQMTTGLLPPDAPVPAVGEYGGPFRELSDEEMARFIRGREIFDRDFGFSEGAGALRGASGDGRFNGDSCRACHFEPVIGGAGPRGVNVMRHGVVDDNGVFSPPSTTPNTILHKEARLDEMIVLPEDGINVFEMRQTPHSLGGGLISAISDETILANEDPSDADGDGISGRAHVLSDGRIGRLGWKAQVPSIKEFLRDGMAAEVGITLPAQDGLTFGATTDEDGVPDPELSLQETEDVQFYLEMLAGPPRQTPADAAQAAQGESLFESVGCAKCHIPSLPSSLGDVPLYSDLLLHDILPDGTPGIVDGDASMTEFRTAPLWGLSQTAPYFHDGSADTIDQAIRKHAGEASGVRAAYEALSDADRAALLAFLETL
ncbi:MAG: hypothetical protein D6744_12335 [Planctomycetota bacterium]|nr:MAG: hypothetical protein D6744_12335 [Planctomycetota bacterium]